MADILDKVREIEETIEGQGGGQELDRLKGEAGKLAGGAALYGVGQLTGLDETGDIELLMYKVGETIDLFKERNLPDTEGWKPDWLSVNSDIEYFDPLSSTVTPVINYNNFSGGATVGMEGVDNPYIQYDNSGWRGLLTPESVEGSYSTGLLGGTISTGVRTQGVKDMLDNISANIRFTRSF